METTDSTNASQIAGRPAAVRHALRLTWIVAGLSLTGLMANLVLAVVLDDASRTLRAVAIGAGVSVAAVTVTAAIGIGGGQPWSVRVLTGALVVELLAYLGLLLAGSGVPGVLLFVVTLIALGKLRQPEAQAYLSRAASSPGGCG